MDAVTRNGSLYKMGIYGINRERGINVQVYICGALNFLGVNISEIINFKLKNISKKYSNTVYVDPVKSKFFYFKHSGVDDENLLTKMFLCRPDVHYDEIEYLKLNQHIIESIYQNYEVLKTVIAIDRELVKFSREIELQFSDSLLMMII